MASSTAASTSVRSLNLGPTRHSPSGPPPTESSAAASETGHVVDVFDGDGQTVQRSAGFTVGFTVGFAAGFAAHEGVAQDPPNAGVKGRHC
ncbi:hypothetical protein [Cryobacterium sp. TMT1-66-1]|uniref:hypothetical protein n=1 Tax=Cryobacterium sp. TMT1-66-1 TaxID=1259242 RepID=UPI00106D0080|nr:hypothetical protein [Cryobacterium sp. TMT1-66-1]